MKTWKKALYATFMTFMAIILIYPMPANAAKKKTVFIAAGHQKRGISATEPLAPGSKERKAKLTSGTEGVKTKIPEYKTNLAIAKATQKELQKRGYKVIMLRTTNDCALSNKQRTEKANKSGADIHICIHCNSSTSKKSVGPLAIVPESSKYVGKTVYTKSRSLGKAIVSGVSKSTGKKACSTIYSNYYTTINYAKIPTFILECGFMSNPTEDVQLNSSSYQKKIAKGIANGVDNYFKTNAANTTTATTAATTTTAKPTTTTRTATVTVPQKKGIVTATLLNFRKTASNSGAIIRVLPHGTKVTILGSKDNWYKVKVGNTTGYVSKSYIKKTN